MQHVSVCYYVSHLHQLFQSSPTLDESLFHESCAQKLPAPFLYICTSDMSTLYLFWPMHTLRWPVQLTQVEACCLRARREYNHNLTASNRYSSALLFQEVTSAPGGKSRRLNGWPYSLNAVMCAYLPSLPIVWQAKQCCLSCHRPPQQLPTHILSWSSDLPVVRCSFRIVVELYDDHGSCEDIMSYLPTAAAIVASSFCSTGVISHASQVTLMSRQTWSCN